VGIYYSQRLYSKPLKKRLELLASRCFSHLARLVIIENEKRA
jgi:hypothetical protein